MILKKSNKKPAEAFKKNKTGKEARLPSKQNVKKARIKKPPIIPPHIKKWKAKIRWYDVALYGDEQFRKFVHYRCIELDALRLAEHSSEKYVS